MKLICVLIATFLIGYFSNGDPNAKLEYGETGFPKNCRAIIYENYKGYVFHSYTAEEALDSIERNCGEYGYSWGK